MRDWHAEFGDRFVLGRCVSVSGHARGGPARSGGLALQFGVRSQACRTCVAHRTLHLLLAIAIFLALATVLSIAPHAATAGTVTFSGRIVDLNAPFVPGSIVTIRGTVLTRSGACFLTRVERPNSQPNTNLWLCTHAPNAWPQLTAGSSLKARVRIVGIKAAESVQVPYSDSFILLGIN